MLCERKEKDLALRRTVGQNDRNPIRQICPARHGDRGILPHGEHDGRRKMRIPVQRLRGTALKMHRLKLIDLDRIHAAILKQIEQALRVPVRLKRHIGRPLQDVRIRRTVVAVVGERERGCRAGKHKEIQERGQCTDEVPRLPHILHLHPSAFAHTMYLVLFRVKQMRFLERKVPFANII